MFVVHGKATTLVADLQGQVKAIRLTRTKPGTGRGQYRNHCQSGAGVPEAAELFGAIFRTVYANNSQKLSAWLSASHVEHHSPATGKPPARRRRRRNKLSFPSQAALHRVRLFLLPRLKNSRRAVALVLSARMIRLVLFDIDGTLVHTGGAGTAAFTKTFARHFNLHHGTERMKFAGRTDVSLVREFFQIHGVAESAENFTLFFEHYVFWLDHILTRNGGEMCRGVREFIRDLQARPQPPALGLLTGNIQLGAEIKLRHFGLWELFAFGGFADDHEDRNHIAAAALARARRVLGEDLQADEIVVIGDTPFDVRCGKFIGARTLAVATGGAKLTELEKCDADWAVADLTQLRAADICPRENHQ